MLDALLNVATKSRLLDFVSLKGYKLKIATQWPPFDREVDFDVYFYTSKDGGSSSFTKTNFFNSPINPNLAIKNIDTIRKIW